MHPTNRLFIYLRFFLFVLYFLHGLFIISQNSVTNDEMDHWSYGKRILMIRPEKIYPFDDASTMPVSGLNAIPRAVEQLLHPNMEKADGGFSDIMNGRYVTLFICLLIGIFIYKWTRESFGEKAGLFSLFLFVYCPNLNANTALLTTDAYAALFTLTTAYYFHRFVKTSGWKNFLLFCIHLGIAQVVKQSLILLPVFFALTGLVILIYRRSLASRWKINLTRAFVLVVIVLLIINIAFFFRGSGSALNNYQFHSNFFQEMASSSIGKMPIPLPSPFVEGYDLVKYMLGLGSGHENVSARSYLLGNYFTGGIWYYYPVVLFFKTPILVLVILFSLLFLMIRKKEGRLFKNLFPLSLVFFFLFIFSFFNSSQHSIRHLIMIYPMIYVSIGQAINWPLFRKRGIIIAAIIYSMATFYYYFPNLISYTNELILPKKKAYTVIASSNIDYGQCKDSYTKYLIEHPDVTVPGEMPTAGNYIIGINYYLDLEGKGKYAWLMNFKPYGHVNHCLLLVRVTESDVTRIKNK